MKLTQYVPEIIGMLAVGVLVALASLAWRRGRSVVPYGTGVAAIALIALVLLPAVARVPAGYRGVVYAWSGGVEATERGEGLTFLVPWAQRINYVSVRTQKVYSPRVFAQSLDLQEITVVASINYHVDAERAAELYQEVGPGYRSTIIQPALFQRTKAAVGRVKAEDFAVGRGRLAETVQAQLTTQLSRYGIVVEFVNIEDAIFDKQFIKAVKNKIIAEQKAQEQQRLIAAKRALKQQKIIQAEADARAIRIKADADAYANDVLNASITADLLRWRWINTWDGILPSTLVAGGDDPNILLGVPQP